ncbi:unnamed protein product [Penicillium viridicatum]
MQQVWYTVAVYYINISQAVLCVFHPDYPIIAVLDREFSSVVPAPRWNPPRAFLWNMRWSPEGKEEQTRMEKLFESICREKGAGKILEDMELDPLQESKQTAVNYIRVIVEDRVAHWCGMAEAAMEPFGV